VRKAVFAVAGLAALFAPFETKGVWRVTVGTDMAGFEPASRTVPVSGHITLVTALRTGDTRTKIQAARRLAFGVSMLVAALRA